MNVHRPPGLEGQRARIYFSNTLCFDTTNETEVAYVYPGTINMTVKMNGAKCSSQKIKVAANSSVQTVDFTLEKGQ